MSLALKVTAGVTILVPVFLDTGSGAVQSVVFVSTLVLDDLSYPVVIVPRVGSWIPVDIQASTFHARVSRFAMLPR